MSAASTTAASRQTRFPDHTSDASSASEVKWPIMNDSSDSSFLDDLNSPCLYAAIPDRATVDAGRRASAAGRSYEHKEDQDPGSRYPGMPKTSRRNSSFFLNNSPSRSHLKYWNRTKSVLMSIASMARSMPSSVRLEASPLPRISKQDFENMSPTIQRKYFSELERLRLVQDFGAADLSGPTTPFSDTLQPLPPSRFVTPPKSFKSSRKAKGRSAHKASVTPEPRNTCCCRHAPHSSAELRFYTGLPDKIKRRYLSEEEQLLAIRRPHSFVPRDIDVTAANLNSRRVRQRVRIMSLSDQAGAYEGPNAFYESLRWMEESDGLDLRLDFDNFQPTSEPEVNTPKPEGLSRRPTFRRQFSMPKRSFSRSSSAATSRPGTKDTTTAPSFRSTASSAPRTQGEHLRRKSKALSLISVNKPQESRPIIDPAAAHYQNPGARSTVREYMTSAQKFDEMLEFGFPSLGEVDENDGETLDETRHTFLDDDRSSTHSTLSDLDSPKTPPLLERPVALHSARAVTDPIISHQTGCGQTRSSREMTFRMTLTRPDLRANDDQIYGWQSAAAARKSTTLSPATPDKENELKESMERHFDALDKENFESHDNGVVKRFWNRVRRS